ncbi:MAG: HYR domain-containing protein [Planctomycetota bacterium]|jgi:hypothetical protein
MRTSKPFNSLIVFLLLPGIVYASPVLIDFEGIPTDYLYRYGNQNLGSYYPGLIFSPHATILDKVRGGYNHIGYPPHSGDAVLYSKPYSQIRVDFTNPPCDYVELWYTLDGGNFYMEAYNASDIMVDNATGPSNYGTNSPISVSGNNIAYIILHNTNDWFVIDDLVYASDFNPDPGENWCFESGGTDGWQLYIPSGATATVVMQHNGSNTTYLPQQGSYFLELKTDGPGSYTRAEQAVTLAAGVTLSGWAAFDARDENQFNDNASVQIYNSSGELVATPWYCDVGIIGNYGDGPWTNWNWTAFNADTYTVRYEVANYVDSVWDSYALFDCGVCMDREPPEITCPPDQTVPADENCEGTVPDLCTLATITDKCDPDPDCSQDPPAGAKIPLGDTLVTLIATTAGNTDTCDVTVTVVDITPPEIICAPDHTILGDENREGTVPDLCALATITDNCDTEPNSTQDLPVGAKIPLGDTIVTLTASDDAGNKNTFPITITVAVPLDLDIKPGGCPNSLNTNMDNKARLPMAILGTESFDVSEIIVGSIYIADTVLPVKMPRIDDVGTPLIDHEMCERRRDKRSDGYQDLVIHFSKREVILALGLDTMEVKTIVPITVKGSLTSGVEFMATDYVKLVRRKD